MDEADKPRDPVINCHTHIFKGRNVPPFLAKTFLPWPLFFLVPVSGVVALLRLWYYHKLSPYKWQFMPWHERNAKARYKLQIAGKRATIPGILIFLLGLFLSLQVFFIITDWLSSIRPPIHSLAEILRQVRWWCNDYWLLWIPSSGFLKCLIVLVWFFLFKGWRKLVWFLMQKLWTFLSLAPSAHSMELIKRYLNLGRFALYQSQDSVFQQLKDQYPIGTGFVVLPMDMAYMGAGPVSKKESYSIQMDELAKLKIRYGKTFHPFVFADPRRLREEGSTHFDYTADKGVVTLRECFIKTYIEGNHFSGFKIYPALGYYAFDATLLPLWKYAADKRLPILTHCIRGVIYYRGKKLKAWDEHPVFTNGGGAPLPLLEINNKDFINNFTHPLNYLCLLEEKLLRKVVGGSGDQKLKDLFGYKDEQTEMLYNLNHLKLCFGHFGGDDEWDRFLDSDRDNYSRSLVQHPDKGIPFLTDHLGNERKGKIEQLWKHTDWYSIICSMMLQYPNVYADLSFILHNPGIQPLLHQTLQNPKLRTRVLYGTDFYVVRNHKSEKQMLAEMMDHLPEKDFDQIARINPKEFLGI